MKLIPAMFVILAYTCESAAHAEEKKQEDKPVVASLEVMVGHTGATIDTKATIPFGGCFKLFNRNRISPSYKDGTPKTLHVFHVGYYFGHGIHLITEADVGTGNLVHPRLGVDYGGKWEDISFYATIHGGLPKLPDITPDLIAITTIGFNPQINGTSSLVINLESYTNITADGHGASRQSLRLGMGLGDKGQYQFGAGCDVFEKGNKPTEKEGTFNYSCGGFLKLVK